MTEVLAENKNDIRNYVFYGMVLPERVDFNITRQSIKTEDGYVQIILYISVSRSKISVICTAENCCDNLLTLRNRTLSILRSIVDSMGFYNGCGYEVTLDSALNLDTKELEVFGVDEPIFDGMLLKNKDKIDSSIFDLPPISDAMKLVVEDYQLSKSLHHYREALREADYTSLYCYYSIECLRVAIEVKYGVGDERKAWEKLGEILSIEGGESIGTIKTVAGKMRHGRPQIQPWEVRKEHLEITWRIIANYINYIRKNNDITN